MSLQLCRQENVRHPYFVEELGVHIYSSQELSYVIFNYPLLVMEDFVGEELLGFLRDDLNYGFLVLKIERFLKGGGNPDEVLVMILEECDYYSSSEIIRYRQLIDNFRMRPEAEYRKAKADELFFMKQYKRASDIYQELLEQEKSSTKNSRMDDAFTGKLWNNLGSCYARMFRMDLAMEAFEKAYLHSGQQRVLEQIALLTLLSPELKLSDRLNTLVDDELLARCRERIEAAEKHAMESARVQELLELYKRDIRKRQAGEKMLLGKWKQEYRRLQ